MQGDQLGEGPRLDTEPERPHVQGAVERATERDVEGQLTPARVDLHVAREHERRDVPEAHRLDPTAGVQAGRAGEPARRHVHGDRDLAGAGSVATRPVSIAQVTSAMVPCPHAVE